MDSSEPSSVSDVDPELYISDFTEMIRDLLRAVAAEDASGALSSASRKLRNLFTYADHLPDNLSWYSILERAVDGIKPPYRDTLSYHNEYDDLARRGVKYVAEITASDGLAAARVSKARQALEDEIQLLPKRRELRRTRGDRLSPDHDR